MEEIDTLRFGRIKVEGDKIITFPRGILGFSRCRRYALFPHGEKSPFCWLQSVEDAALAFVVMDPALVDPRYQVDVDEQTARELDIAPGDKIQALCIVTIPQGDPRRMTVNLLGPLVVNTRNRLAAQVICENRGYSHRRPLLAEEREAP
ncbi:MAG TPA: flagellar assembly protein FliW [Deltaproteobacteria bacterium]|nr:flagellar assembly protein FliW [Deltaproteobacteria bacterium]HOM28972.1 flagellar assembly protein FliW [Deltaproteobacteria bacterium]HPP80397.1 flagellar assembly protein FliW [Deltaproteobacteria bacterium]